MARRRINPARRQARARRARSLLRLRDSLEARLRAALTAALHRASVAVAADPDHPDAALARLEQEAAAIILRHLMAAARAAIDHQRTDLAKAFPFLMERKDAPRRPVTEGELVAGIEADLRARSLEAAATMAKRLRKRVAAAVADAVEQGQGISGAAQAVRALVASDRQAWTIARTEVGVSVGTATHAQAEAAAAQAQVVMLKVWSATEDDRTRESHRKAAADYASGIAMDAKFKVGDALLDHPCDPSGPAGEVINCRCVCLYEPQD